jgi:hypothetical protein
MVMSRQPPRKDTAEQLRSAQGGVGFSQKIANRGMQSLEETLRAKSLAAWSRQKESALQLNKIYSPLLPLEGTDAHMAEVLRGFRSRHGRKLRPLKSPAVQNDPAHVYLGSLGARVPPPFDFAWVLPNTAVGESANATTGTMGFTIDSWGEDDYDASASCALGIYFRPLTNTGRLSVWSNPSFSSSWYDYAYFAAAHTDAFIGLYIARYALDGTFIDAPVNQTHALWDDDSHLSDSGIHEDSNAGYSLNASCWVDRNHQYVIWVWAGGRASADRIAGGASAGSNLWVRVPSITWETS